MRDVHEIAAALLGVWALDACSPEEAEMVKGHLLQCASCAAEATRLRGTADLLGSAARPPEWLRARTLERAKARRPAATPCPAYAEPYAAQVSVLDSLLGELTAPEWGANVIFDWSVQDVVAHLAATDGLIAAWLGVDVDSGPGTDAASDGEPVAVPELLARRTAAVIERERARAPSSTRAAWRSQADALCRALPAQAAQRVPGIQVRLSDAVVARAFETWVHSDDIATTLDRRLPPPLPRHLHPIAALGVRSLPKALAVLRAERPGAAAQVVLEGPGGGEWIVGLGAKAGPDQISDQTTIQPIHKTSDQPQSQPMHQPTSQPSDQPMNQPPAPVVRLRMDVVEFCFLAGGRRDPATVSAEVTGDQDLGRDLLAAAPVFSGP